MKLNGLAGIAVLVATILSVSVSGESPPCEILTTQMRSFHQSSEETVFSNLACLDDQECDSGFSNLSAAGPIVCNFTLLKTGYTYSDDPPNCTTANYEESDDLGELLRIPIDAFSVGTHHSLHSLNISSSLTGNLNVSWGIGSTCDGSVALFLEKIDTDGEEYEVVSVDSLVNFTKGASISGSGVLWAEGSAIHRQLHEGCAIGGYESYMLKGTCFLDKASGAVESPIEDATILTSQPSSTSSFTKQYWLLVVTMAALVFAIW